MVIWSFNGFHDQLITLSTDGVQKRDVTSFTDDPFIITQMQDGVHGVDQDLEGERGDLSSTLFTTHSTLALHHGSSHHLVDVVKRHV